MDQFDKCNEWMSTESTTDPSDFDEIQAQKDEMYEMQHGSTMRAAGIVRKSLNCETPIPDLRSIGDDESVTEVDYDEEEEQPDDPYARLPPEEAEILLRQVAVPEVHVSFKSLYRYATAYDFCIISIAATAAIVQGAAMPLMTVSAIFHTSLPLVVWLVDALCTGPFRQPYHCLSTIQPRRNQQRGVHVSPSHAFNRLCLPCYCRLRKSKTQIA
jgi:hypothetical protein